MYLNGNLVYAIPIPLLDDLCVEEGAIFYEHIGDGPFSSFQPMDTYYRFTTTTRPFSLT